MPLPFHFRSSLRQRVAAWVALWSLVFGALLPTLSHAVVKAPADGSGWVEVCSVTGMVWVKATTGNADNPREGDAPNASSMAGCTWCATHAPALGLPPVAAGWLPPADLARWVPPAFLHAPHPLPVWSSAHSRAPPFAL